MARVDNANKLHLVSTRDAQGRKKYFFVKGAEFDGKHYRISSSAWAAINRRLRTS